MEKSSSFPSLSSSKRTFFALITIVLFVGHKDMNETKKNWWLTGQKKFSNILSFFLLLIFLLSFFSLLQNNNRWKGIGLIYGQKKISLIAYTDWCLLRCKKLPTKTDRKNWKKKKRKDRTVPVKTQLYQKHILSFYIVDQRKKKSAVTEPLLQTNNVAKWSTLCMTNSEVLALI